MTDRAISGVTMKKFTGKGVYGAVAEGKITVLRRRGSTIKRIHTGDTKRERARVAAAMRNVEKQLQAMYERALGEVGESDAQIFAAYRMLLEDAAYGDFIESIIEGQRVSAEYAVTEAGEHFAERFAAMDDAYMRERAADMRDVSRRLVDSLLGEPARKGAATWGGILCADDLAPSEIMELDQKRVKAFVTAQGSLNSHAAILARSRNIPAVVGVGEGFLCQLTDGAEAMVDGFAGEVFLEPDAQTRERLLEKQRAARKEHRLLQGLRGKENISLDGTRINLCANIGSVEELEAVRASDAGGIGLFRSEFLYMGRDDYPAEEEQFAAYKRALEAMEGGRVIIRTLDMGADKQAAYFGLEREENPAMGYRAIRICLTRPDIFRTQLRALYRASVHGRLGIMFPLITGVTELEQILILCGEVREQLREQGIPFSEHVELGIMIETPAAAIVSDRLAPMVDFFSVGTNDLTQYTLACDRQNPRVERFVDTHHEAILRLIEMSADNAHRHGAWIGICGELAADTSLTETFLRMGIDELSVSPAFVLKVRDVVRSLDLSR